MVVRLAKMKLLHESHIFKTPERPVDRGEAEAGLFVSRQPVYLTGIQMPFPDNAQDKGALTRLFHITGEKNGNGIPHEFIFPFGFIANDLHLQSV
jgi:hypothetical protein